jgi:outer membrane receptor protein involved in Fe transport
LAEATNSRNNFATNIPFDTYNLSRVTVNRGANNILFGLGSPAGIINYSTIKTNFINTNEIELRYGSYGSHRASIDAERVLINDKLSFRFAGLYKDQRFQQDPAFEREKRAYGSLEFRPFENTVIRFSGETGEIDGNRPRMFAPIDQLSQWWDPRLVDVVGQIKPLHVPSREGAFSVLTLDGSTRNNIFGPTALLLQPSLVWKGPSQSEVDGSLNGGIPDAFVAFNILGASERASFGTIRESATINRGLDPANASRAAFFTNNMITDRSIYDYREQLIDGPNKSELLDFDSYDFSIEQRFWENKAGVEYAFNHEKTRSRIESLLAPGGRQSSIAIDNNQFFPDGTPNPNLGRPMVTFLGGSRSTNETERENHRLTAFIKLNADDHIDGLLGRILGQHTFTGLYEENTNERSNFGFVKYAWDDRYKDVLSAAGGSATITNGPWRTVGGLVYVGDSLLDASSPSGANVSNLNAPLAIGGDYTSLVWHVENDTWQNSEVGVVENVPNGGRLIKDEAETRALILQSRLLDDLLVGTFGWRTDKRSLFENGNPPRDAQDGRRVIDPINFQLPETANQRTETDTFSWGLVLHTPDFIKENLPFGADLSFHYSESENFQGSSVRSDFYGRPLLPPSGVTEEIGFTLSLLDQKIVARFNWFKSSQQGVSEMGGGVTNLVSLEADTIGRGPGVVEENPFNQDDIANRINFPAIPQEIMELYNVIYLPEVEGYEITTPSGLTGTTDLVSEGFEFELTANLTEGWTTTFNIVETEVARSNSFPIFREYIDMRRPLYAPFHHLPFARGGDTIESRFTVSIFGDYDRITGQDGSIITDELREWRVNLISNYRFQDDTFLKGWRFGGAVRWQDKIGIGFPIKEDPALGGYTPDLSTTFYGPKECNFDGWIGYERPIMDGKVIWDLQLNVRNLFDEDDLIPVVANPDGRFPVFRIPSERTVELRSVFKF